MNTLKCLLFSALVLVFVGFGPTGCKSAEPAGDDTATAQCACDKGKAGEDVWCEGCSKGFVGGEAVACQGCYAAKTGGAECTDCAKKDEKAPDKG